MPKPLSNRLLRYGLLTAAAIAAALLLFPGPVKELFRADQFMPHATCYLRNPKIIFLHVASDTLIGLAYVSISATLAYLVYRASKDIPFHWMFLAFGLFIIACGFTHFMEVWTVWKAVYWLAGWVKVVTALASVTTAIALFPLVPKIFALIKAVKLSEDRRAQLEAANAELESFAYSVSHDLRAPLRAVHGMTTALREDHGAGLDPVALQYMDRIVAASKRMDTLILDLLEYSRVTRAEVELQRVDLAAVLSDAQSDLADHRKQSGAAIHLEGDLPAVLASRTLLKQVLVNLLDNAIKFVAPGVKPEVRICGAVADGTVRVSITDNGIGVPPQFQQKIFGVFERLHSAGAYPGTGIGLAIVQKAIVRMQGKLGVDSAIGKGSCFWIELPKAQP